MLLLDEADALFGKPSEAKDSHDRYANVEVSYLLQRIDAGGGLATLTSNMHAALDVAFPGDSAFVHSPVPGSDATRSDLAANPGNSSPSSPPALNHKKPPQCKALRGLHLISRGDWI